MTWVAASKSVSVLATGLPPRIFGSSQSQASRRDPQIFMGYFGRASKMSPETRDRDVAAISPSPSTDTATVRSRSLYAVIADLTSPRISSDKSTLPVTVRFWIIRHPTGSSCFERSRWVERNARIRRALDEPTKYAIMMLRHTAVTQRLSAKTMRGGSASTRATVPNCPVEGKDEPGSQKHRVGVLSGIMNESERQAISWAKTVSQTFARLVENSSTVVASAPPSGIAPIVEGRHDEPQQGAQIESQPVASVGDERYELMGVLGEGGMGRVLEAKDKQFGRTVAVKEMTLGASNPDFIRRFLLESIVTANLEHPGVVPVYERGVREGAPFYAMRKVAGKTLSNAISSATTLEARLALVPAVIRAAHALGFAHSRGVVHRDIKPDNIILGDYGETVILDWGIAKVRGLSDEHGPDSPLANVTENAKGTIAGSVLGTPSYMSPEQAKGDIESVDSRSDVFALGAVLYEVLAGRPPYAEVSIVMTLARASSATFEPLDKVAPEVPSGLRAIVAKALSQDPAARFSNGSEFAKTLEDFQSRAWLGEESLAARWFARGTGIAGFLALTVSSVAVWKMLPSLREMGVGAFFFVFTFIAAIDLAIFEWFTKGRYKVMGMAVALTIATPLLGLANAVGGMIVVFGGISAPAVVADEARWRAILSSGMYESLGNIAGSAMFAAVSAMLIALCQRSLQTRSPSKA